jgi:glycosyltransferase involved in cell wall biosynthesis
VRVLYLTKYTELAASSRMRSYQYFPFLKAAGVDVVVKPFFNDAYLKDFYQGKRNTVSVLKAYWKRFWVLLTVFQYHQIVIEKEIFPYLPAWAEQILNSLGVHYIVDYDDAIFHNYDQHPQSVYRKLMGNKIAKVMRHSFLVTAGNSYLADYAKKAGAKKVEIIPTVIDLDRYFLTPRNTQESFVVGWIGTKTTFEKHLAPCKSWILELLNQYSDMEFHIIGIPENQGWHERVKWIRWTEETEISSIQKLNLGIMPLEDSLWERGKCSYKLIQYGGCGIPGIASDVGMNKEVIIEGQTGYLANSEKEWKERISFVYENQEILEELGQNARTLVEEKYCIQVTSTIWKDILCKF